MNIYTADPLATTAPHVPITSTGNMSGNRMVFPSVANWINVDRTGTFKDAVSTDAGIFTKGQFICIGITLVDWNGTQWMKARMAHISSSKASLIRDNGQGFYTGYTDLASERLWLLIGSKPVISVDEIIQSVKTNLSQLRDNQIWSYQADVSPLGSALSNTGLFGEPA